MSVGFAEPRNPEHIPEHNLWTLTKNGKTAEARAPQVPFGIELRIYHNGSFLRSEVSRDGRTAGELAEEAKQAWVARVWVEHRTDSDQTAGHGGAEAIEYVATLCECDSQACRFN